MNERRDQSGPESREILKPALKIADVTSQEVRSGIILKGWPAVVGAVMNYGGIENPEEPIERLRKDVSDAHGLEAGHLAGAASREIGTPEYQWHFLNGLCSDLRMAVERNGTAGKYFDYEGFGTRFLKTGVDVVSQRTPTDFMNDMFMLHFYAAYVGDEVEDKFVKRNGLQRNLSSVDVRVVLGASTSKMGIDFDQVLARLECLKTGDLGKEAEETSIQPVETILKDFRLGKFSLVGTRNGVSVHLVLRDFDEQRTFTPGGSIRQEEDGNIVSTKLKKITYADDSDDQVYILPSLIFSVRPNTVPTDRFAIADESTEREMKLVEDLLVASFKNGSLNQHPYYISTEVAEKEEIERMRVAILNSSKEILEHNKSFTINLKSELEFASDILTVTPISKSKNGKPTRGVRVTRTQELKEWDSFRKRDVKIMEIEMYDDGELAKEISTYYPAREESTILERIPVNIDDLVGLYNALEEPNQPDVETSSSLEELTREIYQKSSQLLGSHDYASSSDYGTNIVRTLTPKPIIQITQHDNNPDEYRHYAPWGAGRFSESKTEYLNIFPDGALERKIEFSDRRRNDIKVVYRPVLKQDIAIVLARLSTEITGKDMGYHRPHPFGSLST